MSSNLSMFDFHGRPVQRPTPTPASLEQREQLARVEGRLADSILTWCRSHQGQPFHLVDITSAVVGHHTAAPDSVRRVLAELRRAGRVEVELLDRSRSLYQLGQVRP